MSMLQRYIHNPRRMVIITACTLGMLVTGTSAAVPLAGYQPRMAIGLTTEKANELDADFFATTTMDYLSNGVSGSAMGGGYVDVALIDTGAQAHVLTNAAFNAFNFSGAGRVGTNVTEVTGVAGSEFVTIHDPIGFYAAPLNELTSTTGPLSVNTSAFVGQYNTSILSAGPSSILPNVIGMPLLAQFATVIQVDQQHQVSVGGETFNSPQVDLLPFGDPAIPEYTRFAPLFMEPGSAFLTPPAYFPSLDLFGDLSNNPTSPTATPGAFFLNARMGDAGNSAPWDKFFFDTGAQITVISETVAFMLGYQIGDAEQFIEVEGAGGEVVNAPVITLDSLEILTSDGGLTLTDIPVAVLNVPDPRDGVNPVPGILGTNLFNDRNIVINPEVGNAFVAISDVVLISGDLNSDGFVGIEDLNLVLASWNQNVTEGDLLSGDPTGDGFVGIEDLNIVLANWNVGTPPPSLAIPEPATLVLVSYAGMALLRRRVA